MGVNHSKLNNNNEQKNNNNNDNNKLQIIDFGSIIPLGLYNNNDEYDLNLVRNLILSKKLSPFYKGLSSPLSLLRANNDDDDKINNKQGDTNTICMMNKDRKKKRMITTTTATTITKKKKQQQQQKEAQNEYILYLYSNEKKYHLLYSNSVECPICFLYYPANINFARCCDQPICTECFVQIKKKPASATVHTTVTSSSDYYSSSSNIVCPYCMTEDFGIIYQSPSLSSSNELILEEKSYQVVSTTSGLSENQNIKRKSIESNHPDVVLIDHVRSRHNKGMPSNHSGANNNSSRSPIQFWFHHQSRPSLENYLSTIRLDDMSLEDIIVIQSIRQSVIDNEQHVY